MKTVTLVQNVRNSVDLTVIINILCFLNLKFRHPMITSGEDIGFDFLVHFIYTYVTGWYYHIKCFVLNILGS